MFELELTRQYLKDLKLARKRGLEMVNGEWLRDSPGLYDNDDENRKRSKHPIKN